MARVDVLTFAEAIARDSRTKHPRAVLLGNGFSIAWKASIFHYRSLYDEARLTGLSVPKAALFDALDTRDFEHVIEHLLSAASLIRLYQVDDDFADALEDDAYVVRDGLAEVLAERHPYAATQVLESEYEHARAFLASFDRLFTLNYDLLLYWVINHMESPGARPPRADGFQFPTLQDQSKLVWKRTLAEASQRVFWLHGGLHMFVEDRRLRKLRFSLAEPLIVQVQEKLHQGTYPLVVTEGKSKDKVAHIRRSRYLRFCRDSLMELEGSLFLYGTSLAPNDQHIWDSIASKDSRIASLYVGLHEPTSDDAENVRHIARRLRVKREQAGGAPLKVRFYDAGSAHVWR